MAKSKKQGVTGSPPAAGAAQPVAPAEPATADAVRPAAAFDSPLAPREARFGLGSYVVMNVIFDAFCLLQLLLVSIVLKEEKGLYFFFGLLMVAFFVVSLFDYLYDRHIDPVPDAG